MNAEPVLELRELTVEFATPDGGRRPVVEGVSLEIAAGERVAMVGESGSGKSVIATACLGLVAPGGRIVSGAVEVAAVDMLHAPRNTQRVLRGGVVGLVFQEPASALNPVFTVAFQLTETVRAHRRLARAEAAAEARRLLEEVAFDEPDEVLGAYPHQLSGGQAQRVMIALALAGAPRLLIADEPTAALDLIIQRDILGLLDRLGRDRGIGLLLISHDLAVVEGLADRVVVLYAGRTVEEAPADALFGAPLHPYTRMLLEAAAPAADRRRGPRTLVGPALPAATGCRFAPRCPLAQAVCRDSEPELAETADGRRCRCPITLAGMS